jgi:regulator of sigma E protease
MEYLTTIFDYTIPFLVVLTVLVFFHELGHYLVARYNGVRVEVFSVGFGPELFGRTDKSGTRWKFSAVPLGGYVKMFGENPSDVEQAPMTPEDESGAFHKKSIGQRSAIVFAGPAANFLLAIVIFALLFVFVGQPFTSPEIGKVHPDSAAERAGLETGDIFVEIDGREIERFEDVQQIVVLNIGEALSITVNRDSSDVTLIAKPDIIERKDRSGNVHRIGILGVSSKGRDYIQHDPLTAIWRSVVETGYLTVGTLKAVGQVVSGQRDTKELGGPIKIAQISHDFAQVSPDSLLWLIALLSINLGLLNLFPIPMLDGGHLLFYAFETVMGRPLGERAQEIGLRIGLALVISLMVFVTVNDLINL